MEILNKNSELKILNEDLEKKNKDLEEKIKKLNEDLEKKNKDLEKKIKKLNDLEKKNKDLEKINDLDNENKNLKKEIKKLGEENREFINEILEENGNLKKSKENLENKKKELKNIIKKLEEEKKNDNINKDISILQIKIKELENKNNILENKKLELENKINDLKLNKKKIKLEIVYNKDLNIKGIKKENNEQELSEKSIDTFLFSNNSLFFKRKIENITNYISIKIKNIKNLFEEGWEINKHLKNNIEIKENKGLSIGFLGDYSIGKTYFLQKIFNLNISLEPTENINYYYLENNIRIIDIPGSNKSLFPIDDNLQQNIIETKKKDFLTKKFVLDNSIINIMVIDSFNLNTKKKLGKLKRILNENYKEISDIKSLYIIHNNLKIKSDNEYNKYIQNNFPKNNYNNINNIVFSEKLDVNKFEIIHFVPKSYKKEDEVIKRIYELITSHLPITLIDFNQMINNSFKKIIDVVFGNKAELEISDNYIKMKSNNQIKNKLFYDNIYSYNFNIPIPNYICYKNNNKLLIQINLAGFVNKKINETNLGKNIIFEIKATRQDEDIVHMIQSNRPYEKELDFTIKISKNSINYKVPKFNSISELNGLTIFEYILC